MDGGVGGSHQRSVGSSHYGHAQAGGGARDLDVTDLPLDDR